MDMARYMEEVIEPLPFDFDRHFEAEIPRLATMNANGLVDLESDDLAQVFAQGSFGKEY